MAHRWHIRSRPPWTAKVHNTDTAGLTVRGCSLKTANVRLDRIPKLMTLVRFSSPALATPVGQAAQLGCSIRLTTASARRDAEIADATEARTNDELAT